MSEEPEFKGCVFVTGSGLWCGKDSGDGGFCDAHLALRCRCGDKAIRACPECGEAMCLPCWRIRKAHRCPVVTKAAIRRERIRDVYRAWTVKSNPR